ncbi:MAG: hypothetical protein QOG54_1335 [Actinomycetota bacterium]|jgi:hypothetical protein|nr:hypothetical protein [Actinomycetota bacterium]
MMKAHWGPRLRALLLLVVVLVAFSGCKIRQDVVFNSDGSGSFTYLVGLEKEFLDQLGAADPYEQVKKQVDAGDFPVELERYETDELKGFRLTFEFDSVADLKDKLNVGEPGGEGQQTLQEITLDRGEDHWNLTGAVGAPNLGAEGELPIDVSELQDRMDMEFSVTMPGEAGDTNADDVREGDESTTFVWTLSPGEAGREIAAVTEQPSSGLPVLVLLGAGLVVLLIAGVAWALRRRVAK